MISRVKASSWGVGEKLTSADMNAVDESLTYALDKRAGQGDVLMSVVVATGTGRIISSIATGPDSNLTFHPNGGNQLVRIPTLTAARAYTLGHTGATGGDRMMFFVEGTGSTPSGYVDIKNNVGTGMFRLGMVHHASPNTSAEGREAEFMFNGTDWQLLRGPSPGLRMLEFTSSTTWTCPPGVYVVILIGYGGGGGGGGGTPAGTTDVESGTGGGGGGGAQQRCRIVAVVPGTTYTITIGAVGAGGGASTAGSSGGSTSFGSLATFTGGGGGASSSSSASSTARATLGGLGVAQTSANWQGRITFPTNASDNVLTAPGCGGGGTNGIAAYDGFAGNESAEGFDGGAGAAKGGDDGGYKGGGGGGGGGGGPGGVGGAGGAGGVAGSAGGGGNGTDGSAAAANTGAGGGGGGAAGQGLILGAITGIGGNGGSGKLTIIF